MGELPDLLLGGLGSMGELRDLLLGGLGPLVRLPGLVLRDLDELVGLQDLVVQLVRVKLRWLARSSAVCARFSAWLSCSVARRSTCLSSSAC